MNLAVTGGRDHTPDGFAASWLLGKLSELGATRLLHGNARGVDRWAARTVGTFPIKKFDADWERYGKSAGHRRNAEMIKHADALLAFPGGVGTANCIEHARRKGIPVIHCPF